VIDGAQLTRAQPAHEPLGVVPVALAPAPRLATPVAHDHSRHPPDEQVVKPLRLRALLERDVHRAAHPAHELEQGRRLGRYDTPRDHASGVVTDDGHHRCLVDVESDILGRLLHESRSLL